MITKTSYNSNSSFFHLSDLMDRSSLLESFYASSIEPTYKPRKIVEKVPGFSKNDIKVFLQYEGICAYLRIEAEKDHEDLGKISISKKYYLGTNVNIAKNDISAKVENGVLKIDLSHLRELQEAKTNLRIDVT